MCSMTRPLDVRMLSQTRRVIPLIFRNGEVWHTDVRLPHLLVENRSDADVTLGRVSVLAVAGDGEVATFYRDKGAVYDAVSDASALLNKLVGKRESPWRTYNLRVLFACEPPTGEVFEEVSCLKPGRKTCLPLGDLFPFDVAAHAPIDRAVLRLDFESGGAQETAAFEIPLTPYECRGDYEFPVRGAVTIEATPWSRELGHREAIPQEFAFDVIDVRRREDGRLALSSPAGSADVSDYFAFDRDVLAVGDGVVVEAGNGWPDAFAENPLAYSVERVTEFTVELLEQGMPFSHAILGNYAVIDHRNGEFSLYAHMREGSVTVNVGDEVRRGQVIGRIGNTSNSEGPHLHFQLMDGPDFRFANGLPPRFANLSTELASDGGLLDANPLLYSDYILRYISEEEGSPPCPS